jgi:hypothetical protein
MDVSPFRFVRGHVTSQMVQTTFNTVEAIVWFAIAIGLAWRSLSAAGRTKNIGITAAVAFAAFGVSDLVEIQTGAWYRPAWLLAWKVACIVILVACYFRMRRLREISTN